MLSEYSAARVCLLYLMRTFHRQLMIGLISWLYVIGSKSRIGNTIVQTIPNPQKSKSRFFSNSILSAQAKFGEFILAKYATQLRENWQGACRYVEFKNGVSEFLFSL